jgi:hypothetical protein
MHPHRIVHQRWLVGTLLALCATAAQASSHREAPFVTEHPKVDATDFYMFRSYEAGRADYVTIVACYIPFQPPYGGPNFFQLDSDALYEIHIDNDADAEEDLTFQFRFTNELKDIALDIGPEGNKKSVPVPVINVGQISAGNTDALNIEESYTVTLVRGDRRFGSRHTIKNADTNARKFLKPVDNIGQKSIPDYDAYAAAHTYNIKLPGSSQNGRMFVGQRKDPFAVNLGEAFDLVNITNPLGPPDAEQNVLEDNSVTAFVLELPISWLTDSHHPIIGGWTTASMRQAQILNPHPSFMFPALSGGPWVQVSRLSSPLVNELVIGIRDKDRFNSSEPKDDGQFLDYVTHPTLPAILEILYGNAGVVAPTLFPRTDLVAAFLTGVDGLNKNGAVGEMLRLNTTTPPVAKADQNYLGVIGGDVAGFPNGRRPGDDVVDIELRVVVGVLLDPADAPSGQLPLTDGALNSSAQFNETFPYLRTPKAPSPN